MKKLPDPSVNLIGVFNYGKLIRNYLKNGEELLDANSPDSSGTIKLYEDSPSLPCAKKGAVG
jgi:hypothetical protein